jgi:Fur family peroxide stress response transcriptional regulator
MDGKQVKKLKSSRQRDLVLRVVRSTRSHPTANWIFEKARKQMSSISLGTVYRNLNLLREEGKIQELNFEEGSRRYDGDLRDHYHVRCTVCGKVEDVPHISPRISSDEIEKLTGYRIHNHCLEFQGICSECDKSK